MPFLIDRLSRPLPQRAPPHSKYRTPPAAFDEEGCLFTDGCLFTHFQSGQEKAKKTTEVAKKTQLKGEARGPKSASMTTRARSHDVALQSLNSHQQTFLSCMWAPFVRGWIGTFLQCHTADVR